jgi:hypothetical protein
VSAEDTAAGDRGASQREITERKVKADGSVHEFATTALHISRDLAVVRFRLARPSSFNLPVRLESGSISDGWFWKRRPYSIYRMRGPDGVIAAHRFDAIHRVTISETLIEYHDLVLDWWALPDGSILEEDRDELDDLRARGVLGPKEFERAQLAAQQVLGLYRHIIEEVAATEARLGIWPGAKPG